jgi:hypothetical protein
MRARIGIREVRALQPNSLLWDTAVIGFGVRRFANLAEHGCGGKTYEPHKLADIFPCLEGDDLAALAADIRPTVCASPSSCTGAEFSTAAIGKPRASPPVSHRGTSTNPLAYVLSLNLHRRHLDESQRAMVASRIATLRDGERPDRQGSPIGEARTQAEAAELMNVGKRSVERARIVQEEGTPELVAVVDAGDVSVSAAAEVATLPPDEQRKIVQEGPKAVKQAAAAKRKETTKTKVVTVKVKNPEPAPPKIVTVTKVDVPKSTPTIVTVVNSDPLDIPPSLRRTRPPPVAPVAPVDDVERSARRRKAENIAFDAVVYAADAGCLDELGPAIASAIAARRAEDAAA